MRRAFVRTIVLLACAGCSAGGAFPGAGDGGGAGDAAGFLGLPKGDGGSAGGDGGTDVGCGVAGEKEGTIGVSSRLNLEVKSADGKWYLGSGLKLSEATTVVGADSVGTNTLVFASIGPVCGVGGITSIPKSGFTASVSALAGHGYVGQLPDATYVRFYVKKLGTVGGDPEVDVRYEYPFTACPIGHDAKYVAAYPACRLILDGRTQSVGQTDGPSCVFPMVGCSGNATVEAWGGGGSGGSGCIAFNGGSGGGGGGGGGYGKISASLTAGELYVARVATGGSIASGAPSCPNSNAGGPGGNTSFTSAAGASLLSSSGGKGGGGGGALGGAGGAGGSSSASANATGIKGSDGVSNNGNTLCGGAGSIGPGGAGGAGGNGGAGGTGGCTPASPSVPGGGGSGSSQSGLGKDGAAGQVTLT